MRDCVELDVAIVIVADPPELIELGLKLTVVPDEGHMLFITRWREILTALAARLA